MKSPYSLLLFRLVCVLGAASLLVNCAWQDPDAYYQAEPFPAMEVPEGMETTSLEPLYKVPEVPEQQDELLLARNYGSYEAPRPAPLPTDGATESGVKIQSLADERWILMDASTSQVWPRVQRFLSRYGVGVAVNDPALGLIETDWVRFKVDAEHKHRYRIWIEQGLHPNTTEVHIVHRQVPEAFSDASLLEWTRTSENAEREAFLLDQLSVSLAKNANDSSASLLGQRVGGEAKSDIEFIGKEPVLQLRLSYDRAWATVKHALGEAKFALWEDNYDAGVALVGYLNEDDQSFIGGLFSDGDLPEQAPVTLNKVLNHLAPEPEAKTLFEGMAGVAYGSPLELENTYLVVIKKVDDGKTWVYVRSAQGTKLSPRRARTMLGLIRRNLI